MSQPQEELLPLQIILPTSLLYFNVRLDAVLGLVDLAFGFVCITRFWGLLGVLDNVFSVGYTPEA